MEDYITHVLLGILFVGIIGICGLAYYSCHRESIIYNQKFNTTYSGKDFFFAGDTIRSINRKVEIK